MERKGSIIALLPFIVFILLFIGVGTFLQLQGVDFAFYELPSPVAALVGIIVAFLISSSNVNEKIETFIRGVGNSNIIIMCIIYLLAGAFSGVTKGMGGVDSTVNLGLSLLPENFVIPGLFIIAALVSTAMGTSMGTIASVAPIAVGMAVKAGLSIPLAVGTVVGGAMFGDNLSMISDTTIAATRTQGVGMKEKFKTNLQIVLPAAIITLILLTILGGAGSLEGPFNYDLLKVLPYILVLGLAISGVNVFIVLTLGIFLAGSIGMWLGVYNILSFAKAIYTGFSSMQEIFILSLFIGGLAEMTRVNGGLEYLLWSIRRWIKSTRGAEIGIGALVSFADICTANNTVAIILAGPIAKEIGDEFNVDPRRTASILDIFSCIWQGIIPYGAQVLLAGSLASISPMQIIPNLYYQFLLAICGIFAIFFGWPKRK